MTTRTDNEKLVEEARTFASSAPLGKTVWRELDKAILLIRRMSDALEAAEKAHTPTDDEREADEKAILNALYDSGEAFSGAGDEVGTDETAILVDHVPDIVLALGFRRSEVPEPSAEHGADWSDWGIDHPEEGPSCKCGFNGTPEECAESRRPTGPAFIAIMPPSPETSKRWYSMYCRECGVEEMMTDTADDPRMVARRDEHNRKRHSEPQGEPSDAGVGWFEWFKMPENTTEIAYVHENGEVFDPVRGWNPVEFTIAAAEGRVHRLVRAAGGVR